MTLPDSSLQSLRSQIDRIDDQMHDLIMARCALVEGIAGAKKGDGIALRPGREAEILRRLVARHQGAFPKVALVRIWREIIGALTGLQQPLSVAVVQRDKCDGFIDLARNHFGMVASITVTTGIGQAVKLVADGAVTVALVPLPGHAGGEDSWWAPLTAKRDDLPRVVGRLPVYPFEPSPSRPEPLEALVLACRNHDNTGEDRTLMVLEIDPSASRDRVRSLMTAAGFNPIVTLGTHNIGGTVLHLKEVEGWFDETDLRLTQLVRDPILHATVIGGYPLPLAP
jgi:chorismate mutase / prephenate dehydratase